MALRERDAHEDRRRRDLHAAWEEKVYQPIATQAHEHLNPPNRQAEQKLVGSKSVSFTLPDEKFKLKLIVDGDPLRKPLVETNMENAFHNAAGHVLGHAHSAPEFHVRRRPGHVLPHARSKPTFEPQNWTQVKLQGTLFGHFAQVCEHGPGFRRCRRGGTDMHAPDEGDGVPAVGKRTTRATGHNDLGILKGWTAAQGESSNFKASHGASCGAPAQDHYMYESGSHITDIEFPLGKKMFPEYH
jgi:hypothetical protein